MNKAVAVYVGILKLLKLLKIKKSLMIEIIHTKQMHLHIILK